MPPTPTPKRPDLWPTPDPPGPGQESVWAYPRPARLEACRSLIRVVYGGGRVGETSCGIRIIETSLPPSYYFPPGSIDWRLLRASRHRTWCEWKGDAVYFDVLDPEGGRVAVEGAFSYPAPVAAFSGIAGHVSFHPGRVACYVDGERARAQAGGFYSGWITSAITGPFKGGPGSEQW